MPDSSIRERFSSRTRTCSGTAGPVSSLFIEPAAGGTGGRAPGRELSSTTTEGYRRSPPRAHHFYLGVKNPAGRKPPKLTGFSFRPHGRGRRIRGAVVP